MMLNCVGFFLFLEKGLFLLPREYRKGEKMRNELCCPFLYEESKKVEFEILTDKLASQLGFCASLAKGNFKNELIFITELVYHLNGSIRGKISIDGSHVSFLKARCEFYEEYRSEERRVGKECRL